MSITLFQVFFPYFSYANSPYSRPHVAAHAPRPIPHVSVAKIPAHVPHPHPVPAVPDPKVVPHTPIRTPTQGSSFNPSRNAANSINTDFGKLIQNTFLAQKGASVTAFREFFVATVSEISHFLKL